MLTDVLARMAGTWAGTIVHGDEDGRVRERQAVRQRLTALAGGQVRLESWAADADPQSAVVFVGRLTDEDTAQFEAGGVSLRVAGAGPWGLIMTGPYGEDCALVEVITVAADGGRRNRSGMVLRDGVCVGRIWGQEDRAEPGDAGLRYGLNR